MTESSRLLSASGPNRSAEAVLTTPPCHSIRVKAVNYDLGATLQSGQAFRWRRIAEGWEGVVAGKWVLLTGDNQGITARTNGSSSDREWLTDYLQTGVDLDEIISSFPGDAPLRRAVASCRGLRLLRQDPWECLASFILSSTKQITQIQQIIALLCSRYGNPVTVPDGNDTAFAFPPPDRLAVCSESELRECRMGFRAPYLLATARLIASNRFDLNAPYDLPLQAAREYLMFLPGVGRKIADCVLLFAYGRNEAFPVDVWVMRAIHELYFKHRLVSPGKLLAFTETHFGPFAGYAQQYLFHYMRVQRKSVP